MTRILNLWNLTASPPFLAITTQPSGGGGNQWLPLPPLLTLIHPSGKQFQRPSVFPKFPEPEETDHDQEDGEKVCLNHERDFDMNGVIPCAQN